MTAPFTIVKPIVVNDNNFISSSIDEDDYLEWDGVTTYAIGDRVIVIDDGTSPTVGIHKIYESIEDANLNQFPVSSIESWVEVGATNRWSVFDSSGGTKSTATSYMDWEVRTGRIDYVALLEIEGASSVQIVGRSPSQFPSQIVYDNTFNVGDENVNLIEDWYLYFFTPIRSRREVIASNIPLYSDLEVTVIVQGVSTVSVGTIIFGNGRAIGITSLGAKSGIIDYSKKEVDQFGRALLVKRRFSKRMNVTLLVENTNVDSVQTFIADIRAEAVLWIGAKDTYELLTIYGFYKDFSIDISYPNQSLCTLEIEGLT